MCARSNAEIQIEYVYNNTFYICFFYIRMVVCSRKAEPAVPSQTTKRVKPNTGHSNALHLLCSSGDFNTIRARLCHVSLEATNRNAQFDLEVKVRVLRSCAEDLPGTEAGAKPSWNCDGEFMSFLAFL